MPTQVKVAIFSLLLAVAFGSGYWVKGAREDGKKLSSLNSAIIAGYQLQSDLDAALLKLAKARVNAIAKENKVDQAYAEYLKNPNRDRTRFSDERVRIKAAAIDAANSVKRSKD